MAPGIPICLCRMLLALGLLIAGPVRTHAATDTPADAFLRAVQHVGQNDQVDNPTAISQALEARLQPRKWCKSDDCGDKLDLGTFYNSIYGNAAKSGIRVHYFLATKNDPPGSSFPFIGILAALDMDLRESGICIRRADMERVFGPPPLKGSWLGIANQDVAWNYTLFQNLTHRVRAEFVFVDPPTPQDCASMVMLHEDNFQLTGKVKLADTSYENHWSEAQRTQSYFRADTPVDRASEGDIPTMATVGRFLGKTLAEALQGLPGCSDSGKSDYIDAGALAYADPHVLDLMPVENGKYLALKRPNIVDPDATLPRLDDSLVERRGISCPKRPDRQRAEGYGVLTFQNKIMLVMTGGQDGTMQPMPLVMTELSALMPGKPGPIYRGTYNHAYEYLSVIDDGDTRIYMDFGEVIRDRDVTYVDMPLWNAYRRAAEDHLSNYSLPANPNNMIVCTLQTCTPQLAKLGDGDYPFDDHGP